MRAIKDSFDGFQQWQTKVYKEKLTVLKNRKYFWDLASLVSRLVWTQTTISLALQDTINRRSITSM